MKRLERWILCIVLPAATTDGLAGIECFGDFLRFVLRFWFSGSPANAK